MRREDNPYAPPRAALDRDVAASSPAFWRDGSVVVASDGAALPHRCVKCNAATLIAVPRRRRVYWHSPWFYLLLAINVLLYLVVAGIARKHGDVVVTLCTRHDRRRVLAIVGGWCGALAGFGMLAASFEATDDEALPLALAGLGTIVASAACAVLLARVVYAVRIEGGRLRLKGFGRAFLEAL